MQENSKITKRETVLSVEAHLQELGEDETFHYAIDSAVQRLVGIDELVETLKVDYGDKLILEVHVERVVK